MNRKDRVRPPTRKQPASNVPFHLVQVLRTSDLSDPVVDLNAEVQSARAVVTYRLGLTPSALDLRVPFLCDAYGKLSLFSGRGDVLLSELISNVGPQRAHEACAVIAAAGIDSEDYGDFYVELERDREIARHFHAIHAGSADGPEHAQNFVLEARSQAEKYLHVDYGLSWERIHKALRTRYILSTGEVLKIIEEVDDHVWALNNRIRSAAWTR